jgi:D-galacturonate reductase
MAIPQITIVGGGMITRTQLLPTLYQMQRNGAIGEVTVTASRPKTLLALQRAEALKNAFPERSFRPIPEPSESGEAQRDLYKEVLRKMPPRNIVVAAVPDPLHYEVIMSALQSDQHVCTVKPLVLSYKQAHEIETEARKRKLVVGIDYHKRFDDRSLIARRRYRAGQFGEFKIGNARLLEKWHYRFSNFQEWCTTENSDAFSYVGCHYIDLVHFITGLVPVRVSVYGILDKYPNGNEGYLWTDARVIWNNGACLNVQNALGFPDSAPSANMQGLTMYCRGESLGAWLDHTDQSRGLRHSYVEKDTAPGSNLYSEPNPDFFQYVESDGKGLKPVGYGYRCIEHIIKKCMEVESIDPGARERWLRELDETGIMATPANSRHNELVAEAGRISLLSGGKDVAIEYGSNPRVVA